MEDSEHRNHHVLLLLGKGGVEVSMQTTMVSLTFLRNPLMQETRFWKVDEAAKFRCVLAAEEGPTSNIVWPKYTKWYKTDATNDCVIPACHTSLTWADATLPYPFSSGDCSSVLVPSCDLLWLQVTEVKNRDPKLTVDKLHHILLQHVWTLNLRP